MFPRKITSKLDYGATANLPPAYHKFLNELKEPMTPVHYIPQAGKYVRNERTGLVRPVQNIPLPLKFPNESHQGIWGGEGVIKGFKQQKVKKRRVPTFWVPVLKTSVLHSVILNKFMSIQVTDRTIELVHKHQGFDNYILETKASDLQSYLALSLKREMIKAIQNGCPDLAGEPEKQQEILEKYRKYGYLVSEQEWIYVECVADFCTSSTRQRSLSGTG